VWIKVLFLIVLILDGAEKPIPNGSIFGITVIASK
jgi:hypothetical protein